MEKDHKKLITLRYLISKSLEGSITPDEMRRLDALIVEDADARRYYAEFLHVHVSLRKLLQQDIVCFQPDQDDVLDVGLWEALARHEQTAATVTVQREPLHETVLPAAARRAVSNGTARKFSKFSMFSVAASLAAALFVVLYIHLVSPAKPVVATLSDAIGAQWTDPRFVLGSGDDVRAEPYRLRSGIISLTFGSGAAVVIEGPAEFCPLSVNKMKLTGGKAFAHVPQTAIGFTIDTPESSVVDLGTDFGVAVDPAGGSEVHVYQGKVNLVAGLADQPKQSEILQQHEARKVDADDGVIRSAEFKKYLFAQTISSRENRVVYGRPVSLVSLTDLVMGGSGYGTSTEPTRVYAVTTGQPINEPTGQYRTAGTAYRQVRSNAFIDGIFVPDGADQVVSSEGHVFAACPATSGLYYYELCFDKNSQYAPPAATLFQQQRSLKLTPDVAFLHANIGVTFDLDAVRGQFPGRSIRRFQTVVGTLSFFRGYAILPEADLALNYTEFDVWVVVDGQLRARAERVHWDSLSELDVPLAADERFLSIVVTDGGVIRSPGNNENHYDLCGLADMRLEMESIE